MKKVKHLAVGKNITLKHPYSHKYPGSGDKSLIDGIKGSGDFREHWQGFEAVDLEAIIDLGKITTINRLSISCFQDLKSWIWFPRFVEYSISNDGKSYSVIGIVKNDFSNKKSGIFVRNVEKKFTATKARYIQVKAANLNKCPEWHPGAGKEAWLFVDEIIIE